MGSEGGKVGYMSGGTTWKDGSLRRGRFERYRGGRLARVARLNRANLGPKTFLDGPTGGIRRSGARRLRNLLSAKFGKAKGWRQGRGPYDIEVIWGRTKSFVRPPRRITGTITAKEIGGRRALNSLRNTKAKRDELKRLGITLGSKVRRRGTYSDGSPRYVISASISPI